MGSECRARAATALTFLAIAALYVWLIPGVWFVRQDSATCLGVARSLAEGQGYTFNGGPYAKYPPVFPFLLSLVYRACGPAPWGFQLVVALSGVGALGAAWLLVRDRAGRRPALAVTVLSATCTWFLLYSTVEIMSVAPYACTSLLTLWLAERSIAEPGGTALRWVAVGLAGVTAIYTHLVGVALIPALVGGILLDRTRPRRERLTAAAVVGGLCCLAALLWLGRGMAIRPGGMSYNALILSSPVRVAADPLGQLAQRLTAWVVTPLSLERNSLAWFVALPLFLTLSAPGVVRGLRQRRGVTDLYVCSFAVVLVVMAGKYSQERYIVFILPLLFYYGYLSLRVWTDRAPALRAAAMALAVIAILGTAGYRLARRKSGTWKLSPSARATARRHLADWRQTEQWAAEHAPQDATLFGHWAVVHFFTRRHAAPYPRQCGIEGHLQRMLDARASFVLHSLAKDLRPGVGLLNVLEAHPEAFEPLERNESCALYAIRREALPQLIQALSDTE